MSAWKEAYERLCSGNDDACNAIIVRLAKAGWRPDRIIKNVVTKTYGPNSATIRVFVDAETGQYWLHGEYFSEGRNALAVCFANFDPLSSPATVETTLSEFLTEADHKIQDTFAMRFLA